MNEGFFRLLTGKPDKIRKLMPMNRYVVIMKWRKLPRWVKKLKKRERKKSFLV
jgi:hypothetical protein